MKKKVIHNNDFCLIFRYQDEFNVLKNMIDCFDDKKMFELVYVMSIIHRLISHLKNMFVLTYSCFR